MIKVLVTGGAGYVGSHVCKLLALSGYEPIVYDNLLRGHANLVRWGPLEQGDLLDLDRLRAVIARHRPAAVLHFAALAYVGESISKPDAYYRNNVLGSLSLIEAMLSYNLRNIVFSSSCAVYGVPAQVPILETSLLKPINPYGQTKRAVETMLHDFDIAYGLKSCSLRYFNAAGADPDGEIGELHDPETHVIPLAIKAALGTGDEFRVFGANYDTPDGTAIRDFIHVADLASAHVLALEYLLKGGSSVAVNVGTGKGTSVAEIVKSVERITGRNLPVEITSRRVGDPHTLVANPALAEKLFNWKPKWLAIDEIIETAVQWHNHEISQTPN